MKHWPQRIVCLTTETVEVLYLLGEQDRIVGISGFTTRPAVARKEKPKISGFTSANIEKILALQPDLVLCFSNLQADIAAALIKAGCQVHVFNQRSLDDTLQMILTVGDLVGASDKAQTLVTQYQARLEAARQQASAWPRKPVVYFEEWDEPMLCSIRWAAELIAAAGGQDCFPELSQFQSAKDRQVTAAQVLAAQPDIVIGSWCGKKFQPEKVKARPGWQAMPAVQHGHLYEIKSVDILQPGPALFTEGLPQLQTIIQHWQQQTGSAL
ncbi:MAG: cobalamin-binding protein [Methylophilus sp.]|uniref:cobalamin-binding protein n=1 Tax=Methylophilus sp. TaxID=29541 RepID=UPI003FA166C8